MGGYESTIETTSTTVVECKSDRQPTIRQEATFKMPEEPSREHSTSADNPQGSFLAALKNRIYKVFSREVTTFRSNTMAVISPEDRHTYIDHKEELQKNGELQKAVHRVDQIPFPDLSYPQRQASRSGSEQKNPCLYGTEDLRNSAVAGSSKLVQSERSGPLFGLWRSS